MTDAAIITEGLTKHYGDVVALDEVDLQVPAGTVFGLLGPNGAGKSTLIRLLVGLHRATAGRARVLGHDVEHDRSSVHRSIGYLPSDFVADADLSAGAFIGYLARLRGGVDPEEVASLIARFDLAAGRPFGDLSHGNRQKVGLIQAFIHRPPLVLLDEPTQGLDPLMQRAFGELVRAHRDAGNTVLLSSHVLSEVQALADRVAILRQGRLVMHAEVSELRARARHRVEATIGGGTDEAVARLQGDRSVSEVLVTGPAVHFTVEGSMAGVLERLAPLGIQRLVSTEVDLEQLFLDHYAQER